ncbi:UDP-glucose/GDP-mannose dehydrogenase family protein, partial [Candidatus Bathyarchaeota archaeon]|nr:UDP-glucose/GDP-mannose dehydrogenase family protein [Candidatus Bathyarchaeota archaeon]
MSSVSVIGLGYVGLTFAACLANKGFRVYGVESDEEKRKLILEGRPPFYEPGLDSLLSKAISCGSLIVIDDLQSAIRDSYITFICVGTPSRADGSVDLSQVESAVREIGKALKKKKEYHLVVLRSTVPPGTTEGLVKELLERESGKIAGSGFGLCFNPEFLNEGNAIKGIMNPDRIIIGAIDERSGKLLLELYQDFYSDKLPPILLTNPINAELIKYANNAFLAMKISFANMFSRLCGRLRGADVTTVMKGIGMDSRICSSFLGAGLGWGGSCFPKDTRGILSYARKLGIDLKLVKASIEVNEEQVDYALDLAESLIGSLRGK